MEGSPAAKRLITAAIRQRNKKNVSRLGYKSHKMKKKSMQRMIFYISIMLRKLMIRV